MKHLHHKYGTLKPQYNSYIPSQAVALAIDEFDFEFAKAIAYSGRSDMELGYAIHLLTHLLSNKILFRLMNCLETDAFYCSYFDLLHHLIANRYVSEGGQAERDLPLEVLLSPRIISLVEFLLESRFYVGQVMGRIIEFHPDLNVVKRLLQKMPRFMTDRYSYSFAGAILKRSNLSFAEICQLLQ